MKKFNQSMFLACMFLTILLSGCAPAITPVSATSTPLPTDTALPTKTTTLTPTEKPTATTVPPTETSAITSTPDLSNYAKFTPEAATVNEAIWNDVNWKFAGSVMSPTMRDIEPGATGFYTFDDGIERVIINFLGDGGILRSKIDTYKSYVKVTFSDGKSEFIREGVVGDGKGVDGLFVSEDKAKKGWGQINIAIKPIKDGLDVIKVEIANNSSQKNKAVVLYQK